MCALYVILSVISCLVEAIEGSVPSGNSIMGQYTVNNREQCRRLCWYRKLCTDYGYNPAVGNATNCLLFADQRREVLPVGWVTARAHNSGIVNGCASRPCAETEVCFAVRSRDQQYCLPLPADCGVPTVDRGSFEWTGTEQGQVATLTCDRYFELTPAGSFELTCSVTSRWTPPNVTCELVCLNGGSQNGDRCQCAIQYGGTHCERYIRDCTESYNNGYQSTVYNGVYLIQPVTSSQPFVVYCIFQWGGAGFVMRRRGDFLENLDWATAKASLTADLEGNPESRNFFIGLENLHHLTSQADYEVQISLWGGTSGAGSLYNGFTVGPENSSYALTYDSYRPRSDGLGDDGFSAASPLLFSTQDRDTNTCTGTRGAPGWYGSDCNGYSLFAQEIFWPVLGSHESFIEVDIIIARPGGFYVDGNM